MVEHRLAKARVAGSNPVSRSIVKFIGGRSLPVLLPVQIQPCRVLLVANKLSALIGPPFAFLIICSIFFGCSSVSPINDWVRHRGYNFYPDYSTINPIGNSVDEQGQLRPYPGIVVGGTTRGEIPNLEKTEERKFVVEGSVQTLKSFFKH